MKYCRAVVSSPATIANFGPGFDSFGLCLDSPRDVVSAKLRNDGEVDVKVVGKYDLPTEPGENTASYSAMKLAELCGCGDLGFSMTVKKGLKPGSGLGSSAASSVGGALVMAFLVGVKDKEIILEAAAMGEELISGSRHFDNVAAALYGGFTIVADAQKRTVIRITPPPFRIIVALPDLSVETRRAREVLPRKVDMADAVCNISTAAGLVHAMMRRNVPAIGCYLDDRLSVPHRKALVPSFDAVRESALEAGALGVSLGGSGPAIFAIAQANSSRIRQAMVKAFRDSAGLSAESFITVPGRGAVLQKIS